MTSPYRSCMYIALLLALACETATTAPPASGGGPPSTGNPTRPDAAVCADRDDGLICTHDWSVHCRQGRVHRMTACTQDTPSCVTGVGCRRCSPDVIACDGHQRMQCSSDGNGWALLETCDSEAGLHCSLDTARCEDLCQRAAADRSYIGCDYWAVTTANAQLDPVFAFAVVLANAQAVSAEVTVTRDDTMVAQIDVEPGAVETLELPFVDALKGVWPDAPASALVEAGAYRIRSSVPVTAFQFNPLAFQSGPAFSHTNDASLLLPTATLTGRYLAMSRATLRLEYLLDGEEPIVRASPGFIAIVGVDPEPVQVEILSTAFTAASADGAVPALAPGMQWQTLLGQGDVLQLVSAAPAECPEPSPTETHDRATGVTTRFCDVGRAYDLTGTEIRASGRVAVIGGHDCAFIPHDRLACDHLEQTLFPLDAWGKEITVGITRPMQAEPNVIRVLSGADDNRVTFTPTVHEPITLRRGEFVEFEADQHFHVTGSAPLLVGQFLVGQNYAGSAFNGQGDPSFSLAIPREQWRQRYELLTPATFSSSYLNIIASAEQAVMLNGRAVTGFEPVEGNPYLVARVRVGSGAHRLHSLRPFSVTVYGFASYTSYMYPGGLELDLINPPD